MICKEDFMEIIRSARRTCRSIHRLEDALGNIDLTCECISDFLNQGDSIAILLLEIKNLEDETMDAFVQSYWNLVNDDFSILTFADGKSQIVIHDEEMFYDFWSGRQINLPIKCEIYDPHTPRGTYSWE